MKFNKQYSQNFEELVLNHLDRLSILSFQSETTRDGSVSLPPDIAIKFKMSVEYLETILSPVLTQEYFNAVEPIKQKISADWQRGITWNKPQPLQSVFINYLQEWMQRLLIVCYQNDILSFKRTSVAQEEDEDENSDSD